MENYMKQQQEIIHKQQEQINALLQIQQQEKIHEEQQEFVENLNHIEPPTYDKSNNKLRIDPYKILNISKNYDERSLKKADLKLAKDKAMSKEHRVYNEKTKKYEMLGINCNWNELS